MYLREKHGRKPNNISVIGKTSMYLREKHGGFVNNTNVIGKTSGSLGKSV